MALVERLGLQAPPTPDSRALQQEIWKMPFLIPKNGLLGAPPRTRLNDPPGVSNCLSKPWKRGTIKYPQRVIYMGQRGPPQKSNFWSQINSVQTGCIVKGEAQKNPLFWRFSGVF